MVKQLWMSGVIMAFLSFGIKAGIGIGSRVFHPKVSWKKGLGFFLGTLATYLVLFSGLYLVVTRLDLIAYLDRVARMIQYGMVVHLSVAAGLFAWGLTLLLTPGTGAGDGADTGAGDNGHGAYAGLFLMLPCPVCATVILLNLTMALSLSTLSPLATTLVLLGLFWGIILASLLVLAIFKGRTGIDHDFLGASMVLISLYFLATALIAPIYPKIKPAFAMAISNNPVQGMDTHATLILVVTCLVLAGAGVVRKLYTQPGSGRFQGQKGEHS